MEEGRLSAEQLARQRARITEILLSYPDHFVSSNGQEGRATCVVGLDTAGVFDGVSRKKFIDKLKLYGVAPAVGRFIGIRLTCRTFRARTTTPVIAGTVLQRHESVW